MRKASCVVLGRTLVFRTSKLWLNSSFEKVGVEDLGRLFWRELLVNYIVNRILGLYISINHGLFFFLLPDWEFIHCSRLYNALFMLLIPKVLHSAIVDI